MYITSSLYLTEHVLDTKLDGEHPTVKLVNRRHQWENKGCGLC